LTTIDGKEKKKKRKTPKESLVGPIVWTQPHPDDVPRHLLREKQRNSDVREIKSGRKTLTWKDKKTK